jgi:hypothetical protein
LIISILSKAISGVIDQRFGWQLLDQWKSYG